MPTSGMYVRAMFSKTNLTALWLSLVAVAFTTPLLVIIILAPARELLHAITDLPTIIYLLLVADINYEAFKAWRKMIRQYDQQPHRGN